ncbi:hypothetical protein D3C75_793220 [compost metagenome]
MTLKHQQVHAYNQRPHNFSKEPNQRCLRQDFCTHHIDRCGNRQNHQCTDHICTCRWLKTNNRGCIRSSTIGNACYGRKHRHHINPACHPCPFTPPKTTRPWVYPTSQRELGNDLAKDERHQQLANPSDEQCPDHRRATQH